MGELLAWAGEIAEIKVHVCAFLREVWRRSLMRFVLSLETGLSYMSKTAYWIDLENLVR